MTNFEKIKQMSVEDMADFFARMKYCRCCPIKAFCLNTDGIGCRNVFRKWLESEAEE